MKRLKKTLSDILFLIAVAFLFTVVVSVVTGLWVENVNKPGNLGNSPQNIARVQKETDPNDFTFIVVGDVKCGTATFESLLDVISPDKPAFGILLGDFVEHYKLTSHKLFWMEMAEHIKSLPIFLVPGNHDICEEEDFRLKDFQEVYSADKFSFNIGDCLFVILNNNAPYSGTGRYIDFLEQTILNQTKKPKKIFVFMHVPPLNVDSSKMRNGLSGNDSLFEICKKYNIDYVFSGHHHGYLKKEKDNTVFIVSGGGGDRLRGEHGRFHHLVRMAVKDGQVTETVLGIEKQIETTELIERNIVNYLWPAVSQNPALTAILLFLAIGIVVCRFVVFGRKKHAD